VHAGLGQSRADRAVGQLSRALRTLENEGPRHSWRRVEDDFDAAYGVLDADLAEASAETAEGVISLFDFASSLFRAAWEEALAEAEAEAVRQRTPRQRCFPAPPLGTLKLEAMAPGERLRAIAAAIERQEQRRCAS